LKNVILLYTKTSVFSRLSKLVKRICVDCGSSSGARAEYRNTVKQLGRTLAQNGTELVYGGASIGLMGRVADAVLDNNGKAIGVAFWGGFIDGKRHEKARR
jgi:predicted Rossmann-fold nucleotide-binding protein